MSGHAATKNRSLFIPMLLLLCCLGVVLAGLTSTINLKLSPRLLYHHLIWPFGKLLLYLGVGLFIGQAMESLGWSARVGARVRPLVSWGRFGSESAAAFGASFFSGILANTMLMSSYQDGKLNRRELTLSYLLNTGLPGFVLHLPTTFFILVPLTRTAGLIYLGLTCTAALLRTLGVLAVARLLLQSNAAPGPADKSPGQPVKARFETIWRKFHRRFFRLICYTMPIYVLIFVAQQAGFFNWLRQATASLVSVTFLPVESVSVVIFSIATEFSSGIAAAGALLSSGVLTVPQTVAALILGSIVATPVRALRHQLPSHAGIFSPKLGAQLLFTSQGLRIFSLIVVTIPYLWWS
jgi:hypothetical protein